MRRLVWLLALLAATAFAQPGALDPTFSQDGIALPELPFTSGRAGFIDDQDRTVVVGRYRYGSVIARFTEDGELDTTFNGGGFRSIESVAVAINFWAVAGLQDGAYLVFYDSAGGTRALVIPAGGSGYGTCDIFLHTGVRQAGVAVTPDGGVVVAQRPGGPAVVVSKVRYDPSTMTCELDSTFGTNGRASITLPNQGAEPHTLSVQPDGRIVVSGIISEQGVSDPGVFALRLSRNGALDPTFGAGGAGYVRLDNLGEGHAISFLALGPDGAVVLGMLVWTGDVSRVVVARRRFDGMPDPTFGVGGVVTLQGDYPFLAGVGVDPEGRIVMAGSGESGWWATRLQSADGAIDLTFGDEGTSRFRPEDLDGELGGMDLQRDGRVVAIGRVQKDGQDYMAVARLLGGNAVTASEAAPEVGTDLRVWPNPAFEAATLELTLDTAGEVRATLYDVMGRQVADFGSNTRPAGAARFALDLGGVAPGTYVVRVASAAGVATRRLTVR